ncbi:MAG: dihydrofolate reductase [Bradymonadaceae bacterium]
MQLALIAALGQRLEIGLEGELPWSPSGDLRRFKQLTLGKPVLMGRRTHESIGSPLPGRTNIVVSRDESYTADGCLVAHSLDAALDLAEGTPGPDLTMVIGGASIYEQALPRADRMYLTVIYESFEADAYFPTFDPAQWLVDERTDAEADSTIPWPHAFFSLHRYREKPLTAEPTAAPTPLPQMLAPIREDALDPD